MSRFRDKFDHRVWEVVASIPSGQVMGYGEVAKAAGLERTHLYRKMKVLGINPKEEIS